MILHNFDISPNARRTFLPCTPKLVSRENAEKFKFSDDVINFAAAILGNPVFAQTRKFKMQIAQRFLQVSVSVFCSRRISNSNCDSSMRIDLHRVAGRPEAAQGLD